MSMEFKKSSKNRDLLVLDGYVFNKNKSCNEKDYWRCSCYKSKRCRSCAVTNGKRLLSHTPHNHKDSVDKDQYSGNVNHVVADPLKNNKIVEDAYGKNRARSLPTDMINQSTLGSHSSFIRNNIKKKRIDEPALLLHNKPNIQGQFKDQDIASSSSMRDQNSASSSSMKDQNSASSSSMDYEDFHVDLTSGSNRTSSPIQKRFIKRKRSRRNVKTPKIHCDEFFKSDEFEEIEKPFKSKKLRKFNDESPHYSYHADDLSKSDESDDMYSSEDNTFRDGESDEECSLASKIKKINAAYESDESEDPNLLVDRLRVLMKGLHMGNLKNYREIYDILSQLKKCGYIS